MRPPSRLAARQLTGARRPMTARAAASFGLAATAIALATGCGKDGARRDDPVSPAATSTLIGTLRDRDGDGALQRAPGEPLRDRTDLAPARRPGRVLATLAQLTDTHVRDEESPARVTFLDRLGGPFTATFRPQEALTTQVLDAAVRAVDATRPDLTLVTGDVIDNAQANELEQALAVLRGGRVHPNSGGPGYSGVQSPANPDPSFYRPDVDPPRHPGLLTAAQRAFTAQGVRSPLAVVPGNHDVLVAGEVAATPATQAIAIGARRLVAPDPGLDIPRDERQARGAVDRLLPGGRLPGRTATVTPDPGRRELDGPQVVARLRAAGVVRGGPSAGRADAIRDVGRRVRVIVLDVTRRSGLSGGAVVPGQAEFLRAALASAGKRWVLVASHQPLRKVSGAGALLAQLDADPFVLAALSGDTHHDRIRPRRTAAGGWWDITSAALADFPQQGRSLRVRQTAGGGAVLETFKLDTAPGALPDTARELAYLDAQGGRPDANAGSRLDRNVRLYKAAPR